MILNYTFSIYITNLYRRKISTFFLSKDEILVKKTPTSLHEKKTVCRQWTLILIFYVDVHMGLDLVPLAADLAGRPPRFVLSRLAGRENSGLAASWPRKIFG